MRRTTAAIAAAAVVALLAACGGSSKSSSTGGTSSSATGNSVAAWRTQVNTICNNTVAQSSQIQRPTSASGAALSTYMTAVINRLNGMAASIKAVQPPAQFATAQQHIVNDLQTAANTVGQVNSQQLGGAAWLQAMTAAANSPALVQAQQDYTTQSNAAGLSGCLGIHLGA